MKTMQENATLSKLMDDLASTRNTLFPAKSGSTERSTELIHVDAAMFDALLAITEVLRNRGPLTEMSSVPSTEELSSVPTHEWVERIGETLRILRIAAQLSREYNEVLRAARYVGKQIGAAMPSKVRYKRACAYLEKAGKRERR